MARHLSDAAPSAASRCVGREHELAVIGAALEAALWGQGRIVVVSGEPGIGKTRLLTEVASRARARGIPALWGSALEDDGAPPYWPWRQVLGAVDELRAAARPPGTPNPFSLAVRIAPDLAHIGDEQSAEEAAAVQPAGRFGVFDAVSQLLRAAAEMAGLVVLLDDLHWADAPSLRLLEHVAHDWSTMRALLLVSHRPLGHERDAPLRQAIAQLSRVEHTLRLALQGFTPDEAAARLADVTGRRLPDDVVATLHDRTRGNPFFITEFAHLLAATSQNADAFDSARDVPQGARDVIARHVSRLSRTVQDILEVAAVAGARPSPQLVAAVLGLPPADVLSSFDEAVASGVLTCAADRVEYSFTHALLRDALYSDLSPAQRVRLHARIATELEKLGADGNSSLAERAHHWLQATPAGNADRAAAVAADAAEAAMTQLAYEEAARLFEAAADACTWLAAGSGRRARLMIAAARARFLAGELGRAAACCEEAARLARHDGDASLIADAALVIEGVGDRHVSAMIAELCEEALAALPPDLVRTRSRLLAQLTTATLYVGDYAPLDHLSREAIQGAEQAGDYDTVAAALRARHIACSGAHALEERIAVAERLLDMAQRSHRRMDELWARLWRFDSALQMGRLNDVEAELGAITVMVDRIRQPLARWHLERCGYAWAYSAGRFDAARRAANEGSRFARAAGELARYRREMQMIILALATGEDCASDSAVLEAAFGGGGPAPMSTWVVLHRLTSALIALWGGRVGEAQAIYEELPALSPSWVMPPAMLPALAHRAALVSGLGRREDAAALYQQLLPHADLFATSGAGAVACFGSIEMHLGLLAGALGRAELAVEHLQRAVDRNDRAGMRPWAAESRYRLGLALQTRGRSGDVSAALPLVTASLEAADTLGMRPLRERATALRESLRAGTRQARALTPREMEIARLVGEGLTSREIADAMHISNRTADNHVQHILDKLGLRSRSQIAAWVSRQPAR